MAVEPRAPSPKELLKGSSLRGLSKATNISYPHVVYIFQGRRSPSLRTAQAIAAYLGCSLDALAARLSALPVHPLDVGRPRGRARTRKRLAAARVVLRKTR